MNKKTIETELETYRRCRRKMDTNRCDGMCEICALNIPAPVFVLYHRLEGEIEGRHQQ